MYVLSFCHVKSEKKNDSTYRMNQMIEWYWTLIQLEKSIDEHFEYQKGFTLLTENRFVFSFSFDFLNNGRTVPYRTYYTLLCLCKQLSISSVITMKMKTLNTVHTQMKNVHDFS